VENKTIIKTKENKVMYNSLQIFYEKLMS